MSSTDRKQWRDSPEDQRKKELDWDTVEPDELNQRRRLNQIQDARELVGQKRRETAGSLAVGEIDLFTAETILREVVEEYIEEVEGLIKRREKHIDKYWTGEEADEPLGTIKLPGDNEDIEIVGFEDYIECPNPIIIEREEIDDPPFGMEEWPEDFIEEHTHTRMIQKAMPRDISIKAFRRVTEFTVEANLDVQMGERSYRSTEPL